MTYPPLSGDFPLPPSDPYTEPHEWLGLVLGAIDNALDNDSAWSDADRDTALSYMADLRSLVIDCFLCFAPIAGFGMDVFYIEEQYASGQQPSGVPSAAYAKRTLNTVIANVGSHMTLSNSAITIEPGKWLIVAQAPSVGVGQSWLALKDTGSGQYIKQGRNGYTVGSTNTWLDLQVIAYLDNAAQATYELWHYCTSGYSAGFGFNVGRSPEVYASILGLKLA